MQAYARCARSLDCSGLCPISVNICSMNAILCPSTSSTTARAIPSRRAHALSDISIDAASEDFGPLSGPGIFPNPLRACQPAPGLCHPLPAHSLPRRPSLLSIIFLRSYAVCLPAAIELICWHELCRPGLANEDHYVLPQRARLVK